VVVEREEERGRVMHIEKTAWGENEVHWCRESMDNRMSFEPTTNEGQPEIGLLIAWNEPRKPWKPFIVISLWRWRVQIGFLWAMREAEKGGAV